MESRRWSLYLEEFKEQMVFVSAAVQKDKKGMDKWRVRTEGGNSLSPGLCSEKKEASSRTQRRGADHGSGHWDCVEQGTTGGGGTKPEHHTRKSVH